MIVLADARGGIVLLPAVDGEGVRVLPSPGADGVEFGVATALALTAHDLIAADHTGRLATWNAASGLWRALSAVADLAGPAQALAVDPSDRLYVASGKAVYQFADLEGGGARRVIASTVSGPRPAAVATSSDAVLVVLQDGTARLRTDAGAGWVRVPSAGPSGAWRGAICGIDGGYAVVDRAHQAVALTDESYVVEVTISRADGLVQPSLVCSLPSTPGRRDILVADAGSGRVRRYVVVGARAGAEVVAAEYLSAATAPAGIDITRITAMCEGDPA